MIDNYILYKGIPELDLHGEYKESAIILLNEFISDNYMLKHKLLKVVHGKGSYIIKNEVHKHLKKNKLVKDYKVDIYNDGATIIELY